MLLALAGALPAHAFEHTVGLRYRHGFVPAGILDVWFFDSDDEGALPYDRPKVSNDVFGLEYGLAMEPGGGPSFLFWIERVPFHLDAGYWDDVESPPNHIDGDWLEPEKGLGMWAFGPSYLHDIPLSSNEKPVWVALHVGGGIGLGIATGEITVWHAGFHSESLDPTCLPESAAVERHGACASDGEVNLPNVLPILDITVGPKLHVTEHAMVRLDLGFHDALYAGVAGGGSF